MAIVINGSGTVTGISVGGLPDGIVDAGTLATNSVDSAELIDGAIDASHLASGVGGKLLQVVHNSYATQNNVCTTSYAATGLTGAITPSATDSKILCFFKLQCRGHSITSSADWGYSCAVVRSGGASGTIFEERADEEQSYSTYFVTDTGSMHIALHSSFQFLDTTHSTTSEITYTVNAKAAHASECVKFQDGEFPSLITLMEIGA